jgi:hypothetical protein
MSINDVLLALGAKAVRDASSPENVLALDLGLLEVRSIFGGVLTGEAIVHVSSREAFAFECPLELAQCGTLWLPGVESTAAVSQAIIDAHETLRARLQDDQMSLRKLGLKPRLVSPEPWARATVDLEGKEAHVAIDPNGDLVLERIAGQGVPSEHGRVCTPEDVNEIEAIEGLEQHVKNLVTRGIIGEGGPSEGIVASATKALADDVDVDIDLSEEDAWSSGTSPQEPEPLQTQATRNLSDSQLAELEAALSEDSDDGNGKDDIVDASEEGASLAERPALAVQSVHVAVDVEGRAAIAPREPRAIDAVDAGVELALSVEDQEDKNVLTARGPGGGAGRTLSEKGAPAWAAQGAPAAQERETVHLTMEEPRADVPTKGTVSQPDAFAEDPVPPAVPRSEDAWEDDLDALVGGLGTPPSPARATDEPETAAAAAVAQQGVAAPTRARKATTLDLEIEGDGELDAKDAEQLDARARALEEEARALRERASTLRRRASTPPVDATMGTSTSLQAPLSKELEAISFDDGPMPEADLAPSPPATTASGKMNDAVPPESASRTQLQAPPAVIASLSGEATHVGHLGEAGLADLKNALHSKESSVFERGALDSVTPPRSAPTHLTPHDKLASPSMGAEASAIDAAASADRLAGLGAIGLVVEDPRARELLKKHLLPHFRRLLEAPDAKTAASLPDVDDVDALVFVRPRPDDATCQGIVQLCEGPLPPRILIISSDVRFDEMIEVSLRLPLGQRASEVAQQVLDGLNMLGVETRATGS